MIAFHDCFLFNVIYIIYIYKLFICVTYAYMYFRSCVIPGARSINGHGT